jgi:tetrahydromethanopterin S-methyltransferase subunit G
MHAHPLEARMAHVEGAFDQVSERLGSIERRLDSMDSRFNNVDSRFDRLTALVIGAWVTMVATQMTTILTVLFHH